MPDDTTDPRDARDPNHIWLRQSVTFSVNGQTRTLELALPLRPGATPDEVDALLDEADAGMRRLSQRLDAHLAEISSAPTAPSAGLSLPPAQPAQAVSQRPAPRPTPATARASAPTQPAAEERPAPQPAAQPARPSAPAAASTDSAVSPTSAGRDLTRPEFLAAVATLGFDARTVMERLKVRSLNGLNLRETLDLLRRQALREGSADATATEPPPAAEPTPTQQPTTAPAMPEDLPTPIGAARFDEEDDGPDFELSYPDPDDLPSDGEESDFEDFAPQELGANAPLSDVPDLDDLLTPTPSAEPAPAATPAATSAAAGAATSTSEPAEDGPSSHAQELIAALRAAHPGGQPSGQQQNAYKNIVVQELGEKKATSIVRALWTSTPEKLGPEQYDALIRWGKQDTFADEVEQVLEVLRAEWLAQHGGAQQPAKAATPARQPAPSAPQSAESTPPQKQAPAARPATRGRPASRANANGANGANGAGSQGGV